MNEAKALPGVYVTPVDAQDLSQRLVLRTFAGEV